MSLLPMNPVPSSAFQWHKDLRVFSIDISEFQHGGYQLTRIYDDAADVGFAMKSAKTGVVQTFCLYSTEGSSEGELLFYVFKPLDKKLGDIEVHMFND